MSKPLSYFRRKPRRETFGKRTNKYDGWPFAELYAHWEAMRQRMENVPFNTRLLESIKREITLIETSKGWKA